MITFRTEPLTGMKAQALTVFPDECCGFLYGREEVDGNRTVIIAKEVMNAKEGDKRRRFQISPKDYMEAEQFALKNNITLLGIYHSHPNHPAIPSEHDRVAAQPYFSYIIVSVIQGKIDHIRSWRLSDSSQFEEEILSPVLVNQSI